MYPIIIAIAIITIAPLIVFGAAYLLTKGDENPSPAGEENKIDKLFYIPLQSWTIGRYFEAELDGKNIKILPPSEDSFAEYPACLYINEGLISTNPKKIKMLLEKISEFYRSDKSRYKNINGKYTFIL